MNGLSPNARLDFDSLRHLHLLYDMRPVADIWLDFIYDNSSVRVSERSERSRENIHSTVCQHFVAVSLFLFDPKLQAIYRIFFNFFLHPWQEMSLEYIQLQAMGVNSLRRIRNRGKFDILNIQGGWVLQIGLTLSVPESQNPVHLPH